MPSVGGPAPARPTQAPRRDHTPRSPKAICGWAVRDGHVITPRLMHSSRPVSAPRLVARGWRQTYAAAVFSRLLILCLLLLGATLTAVLPGRGGAVLCIAANHVAFEAQGHHGHDHHHDHAGAHGHGAEPSASLDHAGARAHACPDHTAGCVDLALPGMTLQRASDSVALRSPTEAAAFDAPWPAGLAACGRVWATRCGRAPPPPHLAQLCTVCLQV